MKILSLVIGSAEIIPDRGNKITMTILVILDLGNSM